MGEDNKKSKDASSPREDSAHSGDAVFKFVILGLIGVVAFAARLFSVLRFESMIHEFDPYFNFRATYTLVTDGSHQFWNWFDKTAWYPLGRLVGGTVYPGLMLTAGFFHWILNSLNIPIQIRNVCVLLAPTFGAFTSWAAYLLAKECSQGQTRRHGTSTGLVAAAMMSLIPAYMSRSVAGSYDNECVAIFALVNTYYMFIKAVNTGSLMWAGCTALAYGYMVSTWGGYVFIINLVPGYVLAMIAMGRYSHRLYVAYSVMWVLGTLMSMQFQVVGFLPVTGSEHLAALSTFGILQLYAGMTWVRASMPAQLFRKTVALVALSIAIVLAFVLYFELVAPWTGRFRSLLDPTFKPISLISSVSEHQPTMWTHYFFDTHLCMIAIPAGVYLILNNLTDGGIFLVFYGVSSLYFSGLMVRLGLVLAPAAVCISAVALSETLQLYIKYLKDYEPKCPTEAERAKGMRPIAAVVVCAIIVLFSFFVIHCTYVTSEAYSSPSIVLSAKSHDGSRIIFDDFREAYYWLRMNTAEDAKIMSWWDYGYQLAALANRTTIVDNNTWNNTHIATVGTAMASSERDAYPILRRLDVDYTLVIFGGMVGFASDDINKFLWMVRIGGGIFKQIKEKNYLSRHGQYRIDREASKTMLKSMMYKMCYYRFGEVMTQYGKPTGWDRVRNAEIGKKNFKLQHLEEVYTSEHWLVRIYKVLKPNNRDSKSFPGAKRKRRTKKVTRKR